MFVVVNWREQTLRFTRSPARAGAIREDALEAGVRASEVEIISVPDQGVPMTAEYAYQKGDPEVLVW